MLTNALKVLIYKLFLETFYGKVDKTINIIFRNIFYISLKKI